MTRRRDEAYDRAFSQLVDVARDTMPIWRRDVSPTELVELLLDVWYWHVDAFEFDRPRAFQRRAFHDLADTLRTAVRARSDTPPTLRRFVIGLHGCSCRNPHCRTPGATLSIDHIVPRVAGGTNALTNLQVLCRPCNGRKGSLGWDEFFARKAAHEDAHDLTGSRTSGPGS